MSLLERINHLTVNYLRNAMRNDNHSSEIYSLNRFKERFDHSVAKDYLLGRYGSIPIFGVDDWDEEEQ